MGPTKDLRVDQTIVDYLIDSRCSRQWKTFLGVMADEFSSQLPPDDLRALMQRIGGRFADAVPLAPCATLDDLQLAMGKVWVGMDWGWVTIEEEPGALAIRHNCAPLNAAFGHQASGWTPAFLEGVYQRWFAQVGSGGELVVSQASDIDALGCIDFRLSR